jgi:branched-chain amino acid transport system substrate-binding protein
MKHLAILIAAAVFLAATGAVYAEDTVKIGVISELSGPGAPSGTNWRDGARLALEEINAAGGIAGKKVAVTEYDTQTDPQTSRALVQKSIDDGAFVIWGPVYSGSAIVNMLVAQQAGVPQFVGSEAPAITQKGNPYIFRTSMGSQKGVPALTPYFKDTLKAKTVGVAWVNNEFGKGGHEVFISEMKKAGIKVVTDVASEQGQADYAADVSKLKESGADAVWVYMNQEESARFLVEARKQGLSMPLVGEVTLTDQKVIDLAGAAADGAIAHVSMALTAPQIAPFVAKFRAKYGRDPIQDGIKGYIAAWTTKYVADMVGSLDREAFINKLHGLCLKTADHPNILLDTCWDKNGEVSRPSFMIQVKGGKADVISTVAAM